MLERGMTSAVVNSMCLLRSISGSVDVVSMKAMVPEGRMPMLACGRTVRVVRDWLWIMTPVKMRCFRAEGWGDEGVVI